MNRAIYLDHNATAPMLAAAREAMVDALQQTGNPSSVHRFGRSARRLVEDARTRVAAAINAPSGGLVFTASGTEANNMALRGVGVGPVVVSAVEHDSVLKVCKGAIVAPVDRNGVVDLAALEQLGSRSRPRVISVMLANNETGVLQPVQDVVRIARGSGALCHCDAIQAVGKVAVDMAALGVDMLSLSAHKIGGPQGVGALVVREGLDIEPLLRGGGQERRRRGGSENVAGIVAFGVAASAVSDHLLQAKSVSALRDAAENRLRTIAPAARVFGARAARLPNTSCIEMPGVSAETQVMAFDLAGIAVSAGSACSSGKVGASHVLLAMGLDEAESRSAIRVSFGLGNTMADVERLVDVWSALAARHGGHRAASEAAA